MRGDPTIVLALLLCAVLTLAIASAGSWPGRVALVFVALALFVLLIGSRVLT